jgi:hypothetical protein
MNLTILAIIEAFAQALPELVNLFKNPNATQADLDAILTKYGIDQVALTAAIATAKASGK